MAGLSFKYAMSGKVCVLMWVLAFYDIMEIFTKFGKPQNQLWDLFSLKNVMFHGLLLRAIIHLYFHYGTLQHIPLLQIKRLHIM